MVKATTKKKIHPIFELYSLEFLVEKLQRAEEYLVRLKYNRKSCGPKFRHHASNCLRRPESELFMEEKADDNRE